MKVYKFYVDKSSVREVPTPTSEIADDTKSASIGLYAVTTQKDLAEEFMKTRNADVFILQVDSVDKGEALNILNEYRECALNKTSLATKRINDDGLLTLVEVPVVLTEYEATVLDGETENSMEIMSEDFWAGQIPIECFSKALRKSLKLLEYDVLYRLMTMYPMGPVDDPSEYPSPSLEIDALSAFIIIFADTL